MEWEEQGVDGRRLGSLRGWLVVVGWEMLGLEALQSLGGRLRVCSRTMEVVGEEEEVVGRDGV